MELLANSQLRTSKLEDELKKSASSWSRTFQFKKIRTLNFEERRPENTHSSNRTVNGNEVRIAVRIDINQKFDMLSKFIR